MCSAITVLTTIQAPTPSVIALRRHLRAHGGHLIAIGDRKSQTSGWGSDEFVSIEQQAELDFGLARLLPENHYSRKNLGYLLALRQGAESIFDTDDDNSPEDSWRPRQRRCEALPVSEPGWLNVYSHFSTADIWPRGLPLSCARNRLDQADLAASVKAFECPVQQTLVNGSPDVDAIWRLLYDRTIKFDQAASLWLGPRTWCPFNSQSTWWFAPAFPLLYLPSHVSFRMTDIWRSFIAQRCLWELGHGIAFHAADMFQDRNPHNLLRDFEQEVPGYLANEVIRECLENEHLSSSPDQVGANLFRCYSALTKAGYVPETELQLIERWLEDIESLAQPADPRPNEPQA